jgi:hypothetical protein
MQNTNTKHSVDDDGSCNDDDDGDDRALSRQAVNQSMN